MVLDMRLPLERMRFERRIASVLARDVEVPALSALVSAMQQQLAGTALDQTAIGLDANIFLKMGGHTLGAEVTDYLATQHEAPLILPGQVVQEFWNNQLNAVDTLYSGIRKKFDQLKTEVKKLDDAEGSYLEKFEALLDEFGNANEALYSGETRRATANLLETLESKAIVPFVSRRKFADIAVHRQMTKTPPGFMDSGDGDFYVWCDFLLGLLEARGRGMRFDRAVLVTNDSKIDWVRDSVAHPILVAELAAIVGIPFEIWNMDKLVSAVMSARTE